MTQNQLRYWELRWKQFYDMRKLEIDRAQLALEARKLAETIRSNRANEKIATQKNIIEMQKVSLEWSKLNETIRSNLIKEGIDAYKAQTDRNYKENETAQNLMKILGDAAIAIGQFKLEVEKAKNKTSQDYIKVYTDATGEVLKAFGGGAAALALGEGRGMLAAGEYSQVLDGVFNAFPQLRKTYEALNFGDSGKSTTEVVEDYANTLDRIYGPDQQSKLKRAEANTERWKNRDDGRVLGFTNTESDNNESTQGSEIGSTRSVVEITPEDGSSKIIYSGGSHYGPGYESETPSGVIYS